MVLAREAPPVSADVPRLSRLGDLLSDWAAEATAAHEAYRTNAPRGPVTGLPTLDRELGGFLAPGVHILHAGPGAGKTALALQIAATAGCPALYVSAEMAVLELFRRVVARTTGVFLGRLRSGELAPNDSLKLAQHAAAAAPGLVFADATSAFASPEWLRSVADVIRGESDHLLIVVDSVHSWAEALEADLAEYERLNAAIGGLRTLAGRLDCPVLAIAERNRASMKSGGLSASAGSRRFEYGGESVLDLGREENATADANSEIPVTLTLAKNRHGSPGRKINLKFHGAMQRFTER